MVSSQRIVYMRNHENGAEHFNVALGKLQDVPAQCRLPQAFPPVKGELNEAVNSPVLSKILLNVHFVLDFCIEIQTVTHVISKQTSICTNMTLSP